MLGPVELGLLAFADGLAGSSDFLRRLAQGKALGVVAQMQVLAVEDVAHLARVARVESHPGCVGCGRKR